MNLNKALKVVSASLALLISLGIVAFWIMNPSLTAIELCLNLWWFYAAAFALVIIYNWIK